MSKCNDVDAVRLAIIEIMIVLYKYGIREVHSGAIMRLVGVEENCAREYDDDRIILTDEFTEYVNQILMLSSISNETRVLH
jgi:hypothetical protein